MGEKYISCSLSQSYLDDEHFPTFSPTGSGNPSQMKSIAILLILFNSFLVALFDFLVALYLVTTDFQILYPCAFKSTFVLLRLDY
jgi:hypothetical protein